MRLHPMPSGVASVDQRDTRTIRSLRRERSAAFLIALTLIVFRGFVFVAYDQAHLDSDQAIVGLMAKHLSEARAFPLFFYGQGYMLGVEAWLAAPWMWLFGPTPAALKASLLATNVVCAALIIVALERGAGLRPLVGLAAALFFVLPPVALSVLLTEAQGGNLEPFLYVALLWLLRARPIWFGVVLGIGFLNREFTAFAVPIMLAGEALDGVLFTRARLRRWATAAVAFVATWQAVMGLQRWADFLGPGTRGWLLNGYTADPLSNLLERRSTMPVGRVLDNLSTVAREHVPMLLSPPVFGDPDRWTWLIPLAVGAIVVSRLMVLAARAASSGPTGNRLVFCLRWASQARAAWYLAGVGSLSVLVYAANRVATAQGVRYTLLAVLVPIGLCAAYFALEPRRSLRRVITAALVTWAALSAVDNGRMLHRFVTAAPPDHVRTLAETLEARGVTVAQANYWIAYRTTFVARERVRVASTDYVRIHEYQEAASRTAGLRRIQDRPCPNGEQVDVYYLCPSEPNLK